MKLKYKLMPMALVVTQGISANAGERLEELLVTGTYSPRSEITSSATVIDAAEIAALNKRTLAGVLKTVPGLLIEEQGGPGGLTAVSIRGGEANFTLVLLDGVAVNDPTNTRGGGFDFANLNSSLVERIEVVRGAQSAIYGSDALAGVINIVSRRPAPGHEQSGWAEVGEDGYAVVGASAQGREGAFDYTLEVARRDEGEPTPGSERDSDSVNIRLGWQPGESNVFKLGYRYLEGDRRSYPEQSGGPEFAVIDDLDVADYEDQIIAVSWVSEVTENWRSDLRFSHFEHDEAYVSPGVVPFFEVPPNAAETAFEREELQWVNTVRVAPSTSVDLGADYRDEKGDSQGYVEFFGVQTPTDFRLDRDVSGLFLHLHARPLDSVLVNGSVRYDDPDGFDDETTWRLGGSLDLAAGWVLSANWGEAFKLPSFFALGNALVGNPDLRPEKAESWDIGIGWEPSQEWRVAATYFYNDFTDLVDFDDETFRNVNRQQVKTSGVEMEAAWQPADGLSLRAYGTYTDIDVVGEQTVLTGRPEWSGGVVTRWQVASRWSTSLDYRYTGSQWSTSRHTGEAVSLELDDYHRFDWVLAWMPSARWRIQLSLDNLFDADYETAQGFTAPERAVRAGVWLTL